MKTNISKKIIRSLAIVSCLAIAVVSNAQNKRLPDGSVVYSDGTRQLPNGTVVYKGGNIGNKGGNISLPDGSIVYPDGTRRYPNTNRRNDRRNNGQFIPPGQAKKMYGGSARDYAPGQQKKWKKHEDDDDQGHGNGHGHEKHD